MQILSVCLLFNIGSLLTAQTFTARLAGTVVDPAGAPIAGATIVATQVETNATKTVSSDSSGICVLPIVPPGNYEISVVAAGFQKKLQK